MTKEEELMDFLHKKVFDPVLESNNASPSVKSGVNQTITRMNMLSAEKMVHFYWAAITGENGMLFADKMKAEGFTRFEDVVDEFKERFNDDWLTS